MWRNLNHYSKIGVDRISIPSAALAPWFFQIFITKIWMVLAPMSIVLIFCHYKKIRTRRLWALVKMKLFVRGCRMASATGRKSVLAITMFSLVSAFSMPHDAEAAFELIDPNQSSLTKPASITPVAQGPASLPRIQGNRLNGYGHETPLKDVMMLSIPATWIVRYNKPELRDIKVDFRADNVTSDELLGDLATRYGVSFKYGETSGVVTVDWTSGTCVSGYDAKIKSKIIC